MDMVSVSSTLLFIAFIAYLIATLLFGGAVKSSSTKNVIRNHSIVGVN